MAKLIGTDPNQVPTNADLGTMAYQDYDQLAPSFYAGRKNLLLNSNFTISQRGSWTSATSVGSGAYTLDRWVTTIGSVTATLQTRQNQTLPNGQNVNTLRMVCTSGGSGYIQIRQLFDTDIGKFCRNQPVTFSVWMRTTKTDHDGFGPSILNPNVSWQTYGGPIIADGEWHLYKKTTTISNSAGTTAGDMAVAIQNNNTWVTGEEFEIALPQFEIGTSRSEFVYRPVHEELLECQRYFLIYRPNRENAVYTSFANKFHMGQLTLQGQMRTDPTATWYDGNMRFAQVGYNSVSATVANTQAHAFITTGMERQAIHFYIDRAAGGSNPTGDGVYNSEGSTARFFLDAEL